MHTRFFTVISVTVMICCIFMLTHVFTSHKTQAHPPVIGFISPHHLVAEKMIDEIFAHATRRNADTPIDHIILITPNHFAAPTGHITVSHADWQTKNGTIAGNPAFTAHVSASESPVYVNDAVFDGEHGVHALLPFVKTYFPRSTLTAIMINPGTPQKEITQFATLLASQNTQENTLMILSSDFSHELTPHISAVHDAKALDVITHFDLDHVYQLDTDCVEGLYLLMQFAQMRGYTHFAPQGNSNSSEPVHNLLL